MNFDMKIADEFVDNLKGIEDILINGGVFIRKAERENTFEFTAIVIHEDNTPVISYGLINLDDCKDDIAFINYAKEEGMTIDELIDTGTFAASFILESNFEIIHVNEEYARDAEQFLNETGITAILE